MTNPTDPTKPDPELERQRRLDAAQKATADRENAAARARDDRLIEAEELSAALAGSLGERGRDFEIVNNPHGVFGLRKPDTVAIRVWERTNEKKKLELEWMIAFLRVYIEPKDKQLVWAQTAGSRPGLCWQTSTAFVGLMGVDLDEAQKK